VLGAVIALLIAGIIAWQLADVQSGLAAGGGGWRFALLLLIPPLIVGVAIFAARLAVLRALRRMP